MKHAGVLAVMVYATATTIVAAQEPRAFICRFSGGVVAQYQNGWQADVTNDPMDFTLAALDGAKGVAQLVGNLGAAQVHFIKGDETWNFIEVTLAGNVNVTTVFALKGERTFPGVHSRHPALLDGPMPSQRRGACEGRY